MFKNLIYFGSAQFTADIFESLMEAKIVNIVAVVTTPDRPVGRKHLLTPSPLAQAAEKYNLPVYKPEKLDEANLAHLKLLKPDIFLVVAYGQYFNQNWLSTPTIATLNIHFSLLPKYRGALCISECLLNGEKETGVTLMEMGEKLDAGPIISQVKVEISQADDCRILTAKLRDAASQLLKYELPIYLDGAVSAYQQDETMATYTASYKTKTRQNAFIEWEKIEKALKKDTDLSHKWNVHNFIRSNNPEPGAWTIYAPSSLRDTTLGRPKQSIPVELKIIKTSLLIDNNFYLDIVQLPGKEPISWQQYTKKSNIKKLPQGSFFI